MFPNFHLSFYLVFYQCPLLLSFGNPFLPLIFTHYCHSPFLPLILSQLSLPASCLFPFWFLLIACSSSLLPIAYLFCLRGLQQYSRNPLCPGHDLKRCSVDIHRGVQIQWRREHSQVPGKSGLTQMSSRVKELRAALFCSIDLWYHLNTSLVQLDFSLDWIIHHLLPSLLLQGSQGLYEIGYRAPFCPGNDKPAHLCTRLVAWELDYQNMAFIVHLGDLFPRHLGT